MFPRKMFGDGTSAALKIFPSRHSELTTPLCSTTQQVMAIGWSLFWVRRGTDGLNRSHHGPLGRADGVSAECSRGCSRNRRRVVISALHTPF
jgi:hypothetical protein